jgi:hypothetical protein
LIRQNDSNCFLAAVANILSPRVIFWERYFGKESKYFKKDRYCCSSVNQEFRDLNGKFLHPYLKKEWKNLEWSNIRNVANGTYLIVVGWDGMSYYKEGGKEKVRVLHAISIDFSTDYEPIFYDSSEPSIAYVFEPYTMFKILPVIIELYTINQSLLPEEPLSYNMINN